MMTKMPRIKEYKAGYMTAKEVSILKQVSVVAVLKNTKLPYTVIKGVRWYAVSDVEKYKPKVKNKV